MYNKPIVLCAMLLISAATVSLHAGGDITFTDGGSHVVDGRMTPSLNSVTVNDNGQLDMKDVYVKYLTTKQPSEVYAHNCSGKDWWLTDPICVLNWVGCNTVTFDNSKAHETAPWNDYRHQHWDNTIYNFGSESLYTAYYQMLGKANNSDITMSNQRLVVSSDNQRIQIKNPAIRNINVYNPSKFTSRIKCTNPQILTSVYSTGGGLVVDTNDASKIEMSGNSVKQELPIQ